MQGFVIDTEFGAGQDHLWEGDTAIDTLMRDHGISEDDALFLFGEYAQEIENDIYYFDLEDAVESL